MSDAKQRILSRLAEFRRNDVELPTPLATPTVYDDRLAQFRSVGHNRYVPLAELFL